MAISVKAAGGGGLSSSDVSASSAQVLKGYSTLTTDSNDEIKEGTIETQSASGTTILDDTTTSVNFTPGYYPNTHSAQHTTVDIPNPTISVDSDTGVITASGSWTKGFTVDNSYSNTKNQTVKAATSYHPDIVDQKIDKGTFLTGDQTFKKVVYGGVSASNIKDGATITIGDEDDADRIISMTGTFTDSSTVSSGQTAATANDLLSTKSAWVDGSEVKGTILTYDNTIVELPTIKVITGGTATGVKIYSYTSTEETTLYNELITAGYTASELEDAKYINITGTTPGTVILDLTDVGIAGDNIKLLHKKSSDNSWETLYTGVIPSTYQVTVTLTEFSPVVKFDYNPNTELVSVKMYATSWLES